MPPLDVDSQFKFLIACIKHSTAGKVDFTEVAKECDIVTKGAAAKRYERLMKAHGIGTSGGAKAEPRDSKEGVKRAPNKKRKLAAVDEDAGDLDEPVKTEVKGEVKTEDPIAVKAEQENAGGAGGATATIPGALPATGTAPVLATAQPSASPSTNAQNDEDDDEVLVISATEKRDDAYAPVYGSGDHHHTHSHSHSPAPIIPGIHSFDYAANIGFPQQMAAPARMASHSPLPYGFHPTAWMYPHDAHGYL
ncbi:hypothetical protein F5Y13DRAFT_200713 [Hypoxylon sp. FL1857]|nr:hypothetical protein F5Y13DRAFT_200713 [Hypoxylon sp. FL1857]